MHASFFKLSKKVYKIHISLLSSNTEYRANIDQGWLSIDPISSCTARNITLQHYEI